MLSKKLFYVLTDGLFRQLIIEFALTKIYACLEVSVYDASLVPILYCDV